ncbi:Cyclic nucleotide-gated channel rod photoreceptor subunit alpha [Taenia crassiceps]|uniref:Cyclic nucleotide-gated channel rod photoreceptor subunit alpha n=1 Tax=Taenia crassiceps TaxID=6207 RepID=A0ABR4QT67_9CEST
MSHSFNRGHRESTAFEMNRNDCSYPPSQASNQPDSNLPEESSSAIHSHQRLSQERLSMSAARPWRKLRNALLITSNALSSGRKERDTYESNDAFLDYFSTQKRSSLTSYYQQPNSSPRSNQFNQKTRNEERFYFEGFNKLSEQQPVMENDKATRNGDPFPSFTTLTQSTPTFTNRGKELEVQTAHVMSNRPQHILETSTKHQSSASIQNVPIQLEEWGGFEENVPSEPRLSAPSLKARFLYHLRSFTLCPPKRSHFPKSCDSCYVNPSENGKSFEQFRSSNFICNPQGRFMFVWLGIVAIATVYNLWTAIMRQAFHEIQKDKAALWIGLDGVADLIYLTDIMVQFRTSYLEKGLVVRDARKIATRYLWSRKFAFDSLALLPFDLFQSVTGIQPLLRFPRFLKCFRAWHWKIMVENRTTFPNTWRVLTLTHILFLGCHWFASIYYILSESTHFQDSWGYPAPTTPELQSLLRKYLQSFYWATLTLTTIGDITAPEATFQYAFTITTYLIGVFVFATIVGQVGNIINNRNAARLSFENLLDNAKSYMSTHHVPQRLRNRVLRWYDYAWERRRLFGENDLNCLGHLPEKLKTELALHVHLETLKKVTIFHECRPEFLHDLVLKMRPYIFTPGDLICRKGEVAREMFIIADGVLEVIGKAGIVLKRLEAGDFFGEIGILCINGGGNKRTADVRAVGYAELFVLSREDVLSALADHPDAHTIIMEHATQRLMESKSREDAQITVNQQPMDIAPSDLTASRGVKRESTLMHRDLHCTALSAPHELALPGPSRPAGRTIPAVRAASTSTVTSPAVSEAHYQTFALKKSVFMKREKDAINALAELNQFVEEAMFLLVNCSERISARDERINELVSENISLKRKLKELNEMRSEFAKDWNLDETA